LTDVEQVSFKDGTLFNGHLYQYVTDPKTFADAKADAQARGGYLATVTSPQENDVLRKLMMDTGISGGGGWLGGSDETVEGEWRWIDGPETGVQFWQGQSEQSGGYATNGYYSNWKWGEPNDINIGENYLVMYDSGQWNDTGGPYEPGLQMGYFVEKDVSTALQLVSSAASFATPSDRGAGTVDTNLLAQSFNEQPVLTQPHWGS
jgi:Lectin C-type domain